MAKKKLPHGVEVEEGFTNSGRDALVISRVKPEIKSHGAFFKLFFNNLNSVYSLPKMAIITLLCLTKKFPTGAVHLNGMAKKEIAAEVGGKSVSGVNNALTALCEAKIIKKVGTSSYLINPFISAYGDIKEVMDKRDVYVETLAYSDGRGRAIHTKIGTDASKRRAELQRQGKINEEWDVL